MAKRDYYQVLGVNRSATDDQIRSAYRKLARKYHPDVNKSAGATEKFREATEAYEVLGDPQKRGMYDQFGHAGPAAEGFRGGGGAGGRPGVRTYTWTGGGQGMPFDVEEIFGGGGRGFAGMSLDDLLAALGGGGRRARAQAAQRGQDAEYHLNLDLPQAFAGMTAAIRTTRPDASGRETTETLHVKIPAGVHEGSRIRVRGKGGYGPAGYGDLYLITHITPHPYFRTEGSDVYVDLPVSITEAALGAKVDVPTLEGMTTVTIPPGTSSHRKLRLRGKGLGMAEGGSRGDQYVVVHVMPPPAVSTKGRELLTEFQKVEKFDPRKDVPWR
jgi:curved DNA-binding protein